MCRRASQCPSWRRRSRAAGAKDARDLAEEHRNVELGDEVERIHLVGEVGGVADLERDPSVGIEAYTGLGSPDHLVGEIDPRTRACGNSRAISRAPSPRPVPMSIARSGSGWTLEERRGERR